MARNFANGLIMLACSLGLTAPALAADVAAATPNATTAPAAAAASTTSSSTTTSTTTDANATKTTTSSSSQSSATETKTDGATTTTTKQESKETKETKTETPVNYAQSYQNACKSESIVLADYVSYDKTSPDVRWNQPVKAYYQITRIMKGPPLNKHLPIKYEFHDRTNPPMPTDWKFGPKAMPEVGSHWIIFIEHAVPHNGQFETYEGSWGRQPNTEENLNKVYQLLNTSGEAGY
ncbi:MAG TPA: hypothetical protein V6C76_13310 [Drouetiella sp.]